MGAVRICFFSLTMNKSSKLPCVTFVCTGNICRSPMAEQLLKTALDKDAELRGAFCVCSAGTGAYDGGSASRHSVDALAERGLALHEHKSQKITQALMEASVAVFCMTEGHRRDLQLAFPNCKTPILLMRELMASGTHPEIGDPFGAGFTTYSACRDAIEQAIPSIVQFLKRQKQPSADVRVVSVGCDHGARELKDALAAFLREQHFTVIDHGTHSDESVDYPDFAQKVGHDVACGKAHYGVLACRTGIGISISANKIPGVRAAVVHNALDAKLCREHNDANVICFGSAHDTVDQVRHYLSIFMKTHFAGGRHTQRIEKIKKLEANL